MVRGLGRVKEGAPGGEMPSRQYRKPTGQLLFNDSSNQPWVCTPQGAPPDSALPMITGVVANGGGSYTLTGTQLNGQSAGAAYGDDAQMNENYPIVRLQTALPHNATCNPQAQMCRVYYARTSNWSSVAVGGGTTPTDREFHAARRHSFGQIFVDGNRRRHNISAVYAGRAVN